MNQFLPGLKQSNRSVLQPQDQRILAGGGRTFTPILECVKMKGLIMLSQLQITVVCHNLQFYLLETPKPQGMAARPSFILNQDFLKTFLGQFFHYTDCTDYMIAFLFTLKHEQLPTNYSIYSHIYTGEKIEGFFLLSTRYWQWVIICTLYAVISTLLTNHD